MVNCSVVSPTFEPLLRLGSTLGVATLPLAFFRKALPTKAGADVTDVVRPLMVETAPSSTSGVLDRLVCSAREVRDGSVASSSVKL